MNKKTVDSGERSSDDVQKRSNLWFHARVNQREEAYHTPFWLHIAHGNVEFNIHLYIVLGILTGDNPMLELSKTRPIAEYIVIATGGL